MTLIRFIMRVVLRYLPAENGEFPQISEHVVIRDVVGARCFGINHSPQ